MSEKTLNPRRTKLAMLAEEWAREAQEELEMDEGDIDHVVEAVRDALDRRIGRAAKSK